MTTDKDELRAELARPPSRHAAADAGVLGFLRCGKHDRAADRDGLTVQRWVEQLLHRGIKGIKVRMEDGPWARDRRHVLGGSYGLGNLFKKIFGPSAATPVDERALSGTSEDALASSLEKLADGERGWIPLAQAALLFSTEDRQYAFGELDDAGKNRLAIFAADHRCTPDFRPTEGRMYFRKYG